MDQLVLECALAHEDVLENVDRLVVYSVDPKARWVHLDCHEGVGTSGTYLTPSDARALARHLVRAADFIERQGED